MRLPALLASLALVAPALATSVKQVAGSYALLAASSTAGCPKTITHGEPVAVPSTPVSALRHSDITTSDGACKDGGDAAYTALLPAVEYEARSAIPPNRNDPLVEALMRTKALFGTELVADRVCGAFKLRKGALVAFVNNRGDSNFLENVGALADGKTVALLAEANVTDPKRCLYVSDKAYAKDNGGGACFPGDAEVVLEDGSTRRMDRLAVGDRVAVGRGEYSAVFMFTHRAAGVSAEYIELSTAGGAALRATPGHFVHANGVLVRADEVTAGDVVERGDGGDEVVVRVRVVSGKGLFNPQTLHGDIVVDGVVASTYTSAVRPAVAHALLAPVRTVYEAFGWTSRVLEDGAPRLAGLVPGREGGY